MLDTIILLLALPAPALASGGNDRIWEKRAFIREARPRSEPRHRPIAPAARRAESELRVDRPEFRGMLAQAAYSVSPGHWNEEIWSAR